MRKIIYSLLCLFILVESTNVNAQNINIGSEINQDSLRRQIAKLLIVGVKGTSLQSDNPVIRDVVDKGVSGVIFFEHNIVPVEQGVDSRATLARLVADIQNLDSTRTLLMTIDQEGGRVNRLKSKYGFETMLSHKEVGASESDSVAYANAAVIAEEVASVGFNVNFAPCIDVDINDQCPVIGKVERSFSADEDRVSELASIYIQEHHKRGLLTALKHFPGHGSSLVDSHLGFTDISATWQSRELTPYTKLMAQGQCDMVMVSHLYNKYVDSEYPATLSPLHIDSLLRGQMGWDGVVVSDDMQMKAITDHYGFEEAVVLGLNAGMDLFIISNNISEVQFDIADRFIQAIVDGVESGAVSLDRIEQSVARIEKLVKKVALN